MHPPLLRIVSVLSCVLGLSCIAHAETYDFTLVPDHPLTVDDLVLVSSVDPMTDDDGNLYYEIEAVLLEPDGEEPVSICMSSLLAPDPGDLLEIEADSVPAPGIGDPSTEVAYGANRVSLVDVFPWVKLTSNKSQLSVAFFGSRALNVATLDPFTMELGDPTLGRFALPTRAAYPDLDEDGFRDALLFYDLREMLTRGVIDGDTQLLEFRFLFHGVPLATFDEIEIRD